MESEDIFKLFESVCPMCGHAVGYYHVGGKAAFVEEYQHATDEIRKTNFKFEPNIWTDVPSTEHDGALEFQCSNPECAEKFWLERTAYGDWV